MRLSDIPDGPKSSVLALVEGTRTSGFVVRQLAKTLQRLTPANADRVSVPLRTLAVESGLAVVTLIRAIRLMEERGWLVVYRRFKARSTYRLQECDRTVRSGLEGDGSDASALEL